MRSTPKSPRVRRSPEERRAEIAAAAQQIAIEQGLSAVTQRNVATVAEMTPALVAHYAPGMDELVAETFSSIVDGELADVEVLVAARPGAIDALRFLIATLLDGSRDDVTAVWVHAWAIGVRNEPLAERVRASMDAWQACLQGVLERGLASGELAVERMGEGGPAAVAWQLLGMIDGLNAQALVRWRGGGERAELMARAAEGMLGLSLGSLSVDESA